jgi:molybdenum cofactor biosynthesis enzyme
MCKALDKSMQIADVHLLLKTGGKSGEFRRADAKKSRGGSS